MELRFEPQVAALVAAGLIFGLWMLVRGMSGYRTATLIGDTGTSTIRTLAAGEVRVTGVIEAAEVTLVSPFQSQPCVYYRATVDGNEDGPGMADSTEERAVGFRVRDASGDIRVFPRGARWDVPLRFDERTGTFGDEPSGLLLRTGGATAVPVASLDREAAIAALLTVRPAVDGDDASLVHRIGWFDLGGFGRLSRGSDGGRRYREARLEPGDPVTIVGRALPFSDLADPAEADIALGSEVGADDLEVNADIAEARAAGLLEDTAEEAWGNAAIPGFGIGRPVRAPDLDLAASALPLAPGDEAARTERRFMIGSATLVLASAPGVPLLVAHGVPDAAAARYRDRFVVGLLGAVLAIGCALALSLMIGGEVVQ